MNMLSDRVLSARQFVEYATDSYYLRCDTLRELCSCFWSGTGTPVSKFWKLTDINKVPKDAYCAIVTVSKEDDYTDYENYIVRLQKKFVYRFIENMNDYQKYE